MTVILVGAPTRRAHRLSAPPSPRATALERTIVIVIVLTAPSIVVPSSSSRCVRENASRCGANA
jgi:hypothetical protein